MEQLELAKVRDIGQTIGDPFTFIRQNFNLLLKAFLYYAAPPLIIVVGCGAFGMIKAFTNAVGNSQLTAGMPGIMGGGILLVISYLGYILVSFFQQVYVTEFMILKELRPDVTNEDVLSRMKEDWKHITITLLFMAFLGILFFAALTSIMALGNVLGQTGKGLLILVFYIVVFYTLLPLSNLMFVSLREKEGIFTSLAQSFLITAGNWWKTSFSLLVESLIIYSLLIILLIPFVVITFVTVFHAQSAGIPPSISSIYLNPVSGISLTLTAIASFFLMNLIYVFIGINYFSLSESYSRFHLKAMVDKIGAKEANETRTQQGEY